MHSELILFGPATNNLQFADLCRNPPNLRAEPGYEIDSRPRSLTTQGDRLSQNQIATGSSQCPLTPHLVMILRLTSLRAYDPYKL